MGEVDRHVLRSGMDHSGRVHVLCFESLEDSGGWAIPGGASGGENGQNKMELCR